MQHAYMPMGAALGRPGASHPSLLSTLLGRHTEQAHTYTEHRLGHLTLSFTPTQCRTGQNQTETCAGHAVGPQPWPASHGEVREEGCVAGSQDVWSRAARAPRARHVAPQLWQAPPGEHRGGAGEQHRGAGVHCVQHCQLWQLPRGTPCASALPPAGTYVTQHAALRARRGAGLQYSSLIASWRAALSPWSTLLRRAGEQEQTHGEVRGQQQPQQRGRGHPGQPAGAAPALGVLLRGARGRRRREGAHRRGVCRQVLRAAQAAWVSPTHLRCPETVLRAQTELCRSRAQRACQAVSPRGRGLARVQQVGAPQLWLPRRRRQEVP